MFVKYITLASGFNFLLLALVLLVKKAPNKNANNIMGVFFLMMSVYSYIVSYRFMSIEREQYTNLKYFIHIDGIFLLFLGPCVYLFIRSVLNKPIKILKWKNSIHIIPFIPFIVFNIYFITLSYPERIDWFIRDFYEGTTENNLLNIVLYIQIPIYLFASYLMIQRQLVKSSFVYVSNTQIDISWIKTFLQINIGYMILSAPLCFYLANERANIIIGSIGMDIQFVYFFVKVVLQNKPVVIENARINLKNRDCILKVDMNAADEYIRLLQTFMRTDKPYLKEDCNLQNIAENIGISVHQLSNIINNKLNRNFSDFINEYRICESREILMRSNADKLSLEEVGYNCGFGSKCSFNKAFKKYTNLTPSEFRQQYKVKERI